MTVSPEFIARMARIDAWLASMPLAEARDRAFVVLANAQWFDVRPARPDITPPAGLPPSVLALYARYAEVHGRYCDLSLILADVGPSGTLPGLTRIGYDDEHTELCCEGTAERIVKVANDVPASVAREDALPSVFHAILQAAAVLEYVSPP